MKKTLQDVTFYEFIDRIEQLTSDISFTEITVKFSVFEIIDGDPDSKTAEYQKALSWANRKMSLSEAKQFPEECIKFLYDAEFDLACSCVAAGAKWYEQHLCSWLNFSYNKKCKTIWSREEIWSPTASHFKYWSVGNPSWRRKSDSFEICATVTDRYGERKAIADTYFKNVRKSYVNVYRTKKMIDIVDATKSRLRNRINFLMASDDISEFSKTDI